MTKIPDKFVTMVGFAKRAGMIVYGIDKLKSARGVKMLAVSTTASDNLASDMNRLADKLSVPIVTVAALEDIVGNNVKALGITDANMAKAVVDYVSDGDREIYKIRFGLRR